MKFSYQWLSDLVPGLETDPAYLERLITMKTAECEGIQASGAHFATVVAARVLSVEPLNKGKNKIVSIEVANGLRKRVVCGAPNVRVGLLVPWVPPGTALKGKTIGSAVIDEVESEGMLASAAELSINNEASGLLELQTGEPGQPLDALRPDWILEIDNKSLTHRPDLWGHYGMAREVAAITERSLRDPVKLQLLPKGTPAIRVQVEDASLCPRYSALLFENIQVGDSPLWLQSRLESVGLNAINNIVDLTNYVLAELPQPMHAFDADKLRGDTIYVRNARPGESLKALNGETYSLSTADLVIADAAGAIALAGVIGGADSAISKATTRVVFESANFLASSVRLTSARHKLRTDASVRFEKSLDPENTTRGLARIVELLQQLSPQSKAVGGVADCRTSIVAVPPIALPVHVVQRKLGKDVDKTRIASILDALGFGVEETIANLLTVTVPSWRATKDISLQDDLVEEVGRMVGYDSITPVAPLIASVVPPSNPFRSYLRRVRSQLAAQGFSEIYNYSFVNQSDAAQFSLDIDEHLAVLNPIAAEQTHLRTSLLPGLLKNIVSNVRHYQEFRLFEIGNEIHSQAEVQETTHIAAALYNSHGSEEDFYEGKRVVECLLAGARVSAASPKPYEHPVRTAEIAWHGQLVGRLFEVHPSLLQTVGVVGRAVIFDINAERTQAITSAQLTRYVPLRKYPTSGFDLSILAGLKIPVAVIEDDLRSLGGDTLVSIEYVRQYSGAPLPEGSKSVSYHIEVGTLDHTLNADEATEIRNRLIDGMRSRGYELRV